MWQLRWTNLYDIHVEFSRDLINQKSLKSVNFWESYSKNKKMDAFLEHSVE